MHFLTIIVPLQLFNKFVCIMNKQLLNHCMKWAFAFSALFILNFILVSILKLSFLSFVFDIAAILFVIFVTINARVKCNNNEFRYSQSFKYIFLLYFFTAFVVALFELIYVQFINTSYLNDSLETILATVGPVLESENLEDSIEVIEMLFTPKYYVFFSFFNFIISGFFVALIFSIFLRRSPSIFDKKFDDENVDNSDSNAKDNNIEE